MCNAQKYHGKHFNLKSIHFYSTQFCSRSSSWKAYPLVINIPVNQKPENSHQRCCIWLIYYFPEDLILLYRYSIATLLQVSFSKDINKLQWLYETLKGWSWRTWVVSVFGVLVSKDDLSVNINFFSEVSKSLYNSGVLYLPMMKHTTAIGFT